MAAPIAIGGSTRAISMMVSPAFLTHERHPRHPNANIVPIGTAMATS